MSATQYQVHGNVAVITLDNPPVNGLGYDLRCGIVAGVDQANSDPAVQAIVLIGSARAFSGGADIREFGSPRSIQEPNLLTVIRVVEASAKPTIAAIGGVCMGGGLELTLGCHFRVALPDASIALPEILPPNSCATRPALASPSREGSVSARTLFPLQTEERL